MSLRAIVVGGSMGGLFSALLLTRRGFDVRLYERNAQELAGRGAGIVTHGRLKAAIEEAGLAMPDDLGVMVERRRVFARDGSVAGECAFPQLNTSWDRLFQLLRGAMASDRYHLGRAVERVEDGEGAARVVFADGSSVEADLVVAADGFRSAIRQQLLPEVRPAYAGYSAWRGLVDEGDLSAEARAALFDGFTFCLPPGEQMLGYPVAGTGNDVRPGKRRFNFVWYRPASEEEGLPRLLTDDAGRRHEISIPPPLMAKAVVAEMREAAERLLAPCFAEAVRKTAMPFIQPIYDLETPRMAFGRVALVGDSAFVARPHVGAGVTKAAEDACALARLAAGADGVAQVLAAYEAERLPVGAAVVRQARRLGAYMQAVKRTPAEQAAAERHRSPEAVMRETASVAFLDGERAAA
jgi:2-polyprenyl-6-methoxyphenol hydroxylase-like FAD-dependent oxidoreductase